MGIGNYVDLPNLGVAYCWRDRGLNSKGFELAERAGERSFGVWIKFGGRWSCGEVFIVASLFVSMMFDYLLDEFD